MSEAKENQYYKTQDVVVKNDAKMKKTKPPTSACAHDIKEKDNERVNFFFFFSVESRPIISTCEKKSYPKTPNQCRNEKKEKKVTKGD